MVKRAARPLTRLAVAVAVALVLPVPPSAAVVPILTPPGGYGFGQGAAMQWVSLDDIDRTLDAVSKTSASWLRVLVDWSRIEPAKGQYSWDHVDAVVNAARARNLKVLAVIAYTPEWARAPGSYFTAPPLNAADYGDFSAQTVRRYVDRVSSWELWNEPNLPLFFGLTAKNGVRYTELLKAAYPAIKAVQPSSTVVAAGLSRLIGDESPPAFMEQMYAAGAKGYFDAAAAHPYVSPGGFATDPDNGWSDVGRMHAVMAAHGDGGKKIWMTEIGAPTSDDADGVSQQEQARQIIGVLAAAAAYDFSGPGFIYSIRDIDTSNRGDREYNYGALLTSDWQPKFTAGVLAR
jgi:polysaccharide biosynthesis protein PslG